MMKPVKMWAVFLEDGYHMSPPAIDVTRDEAIAQAESYVTTCWKVLVEDYGYSVRRVTVTPAPQTKGDEGE